MQLLILCWFHQYTSHVDFLRCLGCAMERYVHLLQRSYDTVFDMDDDSHQEIANGLSTYGHKCSPPPLNNGTINLDNLESSPHYAIPYGLVEMDNKDSDTMPKVSPYAAVTDPEEVLPEIIAVEAMPRAS